MSLDFFKNAIYNNLSQLPNESIRDREQAAINSLWDVTTNRYTIKQQKDIGSKEYEDIEVWISNAMGETTRGMANGDDFKKLYFEDLNQVVKKGLYYQFDDNTWLTHYTDKHDSLDVTIGVRRCNNRMRIVDPKDGSIYSIPCVIEYDMTAPNMQVTNAILTPNNHAKVMVQGNEDTLRLFKINTRYIFSGRPFKLLAYQNALIDESISPTSTLLYLDLFLDELHAKDDIENQLADNNQYNYNIEIDSDNMELITGDNGVLNASVTLNGEEVNRKIIWESSDPTIVSINENGEYNVIGTNGQNCMIKATLDNNINVKNSIVIKIVENEKLIPKIIINPLFDKVYQYEDYNFDVSIMYGSQEIIPDDSVVIIEDKDKKYVSIKKNKNNYFITGKEISDEPIKMHIKVQNINPQINLEDDFIFEVVSMLG